MEKLELESWLFGIFALVSKKYLYLAKLFICDLNNSDFTVRG